MTLRQLLWMAEGRWDEPAHIVAAIRNQWVKRGQRPHTISDCNPLASQRAAPGRFKITPAEITLLKALVPT